jgi:hypothetical protein
MIKTWKEFNKSGLNEELSNLQEEYRKFFKFMLDCYNVKSPSALPDNKKKEFFENIKKYWIKGKGVTKDYELIEKEICGK